MQAEEYPKAAAHRVLGIPELLKLTFGLLDPASNAANAQVCKLWSELALDCLWMDVDDLVRLFRLLMPMDLIYGTDHVYEFIGSPTPPDWKRFDKYAKRVRRLTYDEQSTTTTGTFKPRYFRPGGKDSVAI